MEKRVVGFTSDSDTCISGLNQSHDTIFIDGTFKIATKFFQQLWVIRGMVGDSCVPLMYFLLEDKFQASYSKALEILADSCPDFSSQTFMVDFEKAEHSAIRAHFPSICPSQ